MAKPRRSAEEVISMPRHTDVGLSKGNTVAGVCRLLGVTEPMPLRSRRECGGLQVDQATRLKEVEQENARLRRVVVSLALDLSFLKQPARGVCLSPARRGSRRCSDTKERT